VALAGSGCADVSGEAMRQDLAQLRQDLNATNLSLRRSRGETDAVLGQLDRRAREQSEASQKLTSRLDSLQTDLGRVSTRLDEISQRLDALSRQGVRPAPLPRASPAPAPPPPAAGSAPVAPAPPSPSPSPPAASRPPAEGLSPEQVYQTAYLDFSKGNYPLAVSGFREFVRRFPDLDLADNAQYWIGEAYFSMSRSNSAQGQADRANQALEQAVQEFRKVPLNYPRGDKVPTAIYKEALALMELKQIKTAQARLQYLVDNFPQSEEAPLARERLASLASDGGERRREGSSP
jgi:TolA-binding protein